MLNIEQQNADPDVNALTKIRLNVDLFLFIFFLGHIFFYDFFKEIKN